MNVSVETSTSSSGSTPATSSAACSAAVPFVVATACAVPTTSATSCSKRSTYAPTDDTHPVSRQSFTYCHAFPRIAGSHNGTAVAAGRARTRAESVAITDIVHILDDPGPHQMRDLLDAIPHGPCRVESQRALDLRERHAIVARILRLVHELHGRRGRVRADELHQLLLLIVLARRSDVEHFARHHLHLRREHRRHRASDIAHVHVRAPEPLAEHDEPVLPHHCRRELVHR